MKDNSSSFDKKFIIWIPCYNEENNLEKVIYEIKNSGIPKQNFLFINSGSTDSTLEIIKSNKFNYLTLNENLGVGYADITAIEYGLKNNYKYAIGLAGNGRMSPLDIHKFISLFDNGDYDFLRGSRFLNKGNSINLPKHRYLMIKSMNLILKLLFGINITDSTRGFMGISLKIFKDCKFDWKAKSLWGYEFEYYMFAKVVYDKRYKWKEVPVSMIYERNKKKYSKIKPIIDWYHIAVPWFKAKFDKKAFK